MANRHETVVALLIFISMIDLSYSVTTLTCASSVTTVSLTQGSYETYSYPSSGLYPRTTTCEWLVQATDASSRITFEVTSIHVDCGDILKFHDGTSSSASAIGGSVCCSSSASCGSSKPAQTTTGNSLFLKLDTDGTANSYETGFTVSFLVGKDESNCAVSGTINNVNLTSEVTLTSPQFPANYPISRTCTYTYTYSSGNVELQFKYLKVELDSGNCFDSVEIFNGSSTSSPLIAKVCGDTAPAQTYTSSGTSLTIKFSSDAQVTKTGFLAAVKPVDQSATSTGVTTGSLSTAHLTTANAVTTGTNELSTVSDSSTATETSTTIQHHYETSSYVEKETTQHFEDTTTNVVTETTQHFEDSTTNVATEMSSHLYNDTTSSTEKETTQHFDDTTTNGATETTQHFDDTTTNGATDKPSSHGDGTTSVSDAVTTMRITTLQPTTVRGTTTREVTSQPTTVGATREMTSQSVSVGATTKTKVRLPRIIVRDNNIPSVKDSASNNGGVIAAGVIVALVVVVLIVVGVILFKKKKMRSVNVYDEKRKEGIQENIPDIQHKEDIQLSPAPTGTNCVT